MFATQVSSVKCEQGRFENARVEFADFEASRGVVEITKEKSLQFSNGQRGIITVSWPSDDTPNSHGHSEHSIHVT